MKEKIKYRGGIGKEDISRLQNGLILLVCAVPSVGDDGIERVGALGETTIGDEINIALHGENAISSKDLIMDFAKARGFETFKQARLFRGSLSQENRQKIDKEIDETLIGILTEQAPKDGVFVIKSKFLPLVLKYPFENVDKDSLPMVVVIGVTSDDDVATERFIEREGRRGKKYNEEEASMRRVHKGSTLIRYLSEAYPDSNVKYAKTNLEEACTIVFDNSAQFEKEEFETHLRGVAVDIINAIVKEIPSTANHLLNNTNLHL